MIDYFLHGGDKGSDTDSWITSKHTEHASDDDRIWNVVCCTHLPVV
jgi:hypothetical protein